MNTFRVLSSPALLPLGWTLVLALWQTTLLALLVWAWLRVDRAASSSRRHLVAYGALLTALGLAATTFWILDHHPTIRATRSVGAGIQAVLRPSPDTPTVLPPGPRPSPPTAVIATPPREAVEWIAMVWLAVVALLIARLAGGIVFARRIRSRATPVPKGVICEAVSRMGVHLGLRRPVEVLESDDVAAPATTGWRRPALIVPRNFVANLSQGLLDPVVVHELEHVRRGDQPMAHLQAIADALLFFCPGALWLSAQVRQTREHRCDDAAVRACGDAGTYARALGILATQAGRTKMTGALGLGAPRLADRIRRVLNGDTMPLMNRVQGIGLAAGLTLTVVSGSVVLAASFEQAGSSQSPHNLGEAAAQPQRGADVAPRRNAVPTGYVPQQLGSPITLKGTWGTSEYAFDKVRVRNPSERRVESVTFAAFVRYTDHARPAIVVRGESVAVALDPGETRDVTVALLPTRDLLDWKRTRGTLAQAHLGVVEVTFSDGSRWMIRPREDARTGEEALHMPGPYLSRALVSPKAPDGPSGALCLDDSGLSYSEGAVVPISAGKPGFARCVNGGWVEHDPGTTSGMK